MSWRDEIRGNPRLRLGLGFIATVLGLFGLLEWHDSQELRVGEQQRLAVQLGRLANPQSMAVWPIRDREAQLVLQQLEQRLWRNSSVGLAQAQFQDWLREQLRLVNAPNAAVRIAEAESLAALRAEPVPDVQGSPSGAESKLPLRVSAQLEFAMADPQMLVALLAAMAAHTRAVYVESLEVKGQRVEMRVATSFVINSSRPTP